MRHLKWLILWLGLLILIGCAALTPLTDYAGL
jgi:hypothetical protein